MMFTQKVFFAIFSLGYKSQVHSFTNTRRHFASTSTLFSSPTAVDTFVTSPADDENPAQGSFENFVGRVSATADHQSFITSPNGSCGIMAIKLKQDDYVKNVVDSASEKIGDTSETGMFGGAAAQAAKELAGKAKKAIQGEDFTGKTVVFSGGKSGIIVAQRPPLAFVICDFSSYNAENDSEIKILDSRYAIPVSESLLGTSIDFYGNELDSSDKDKSQGSFCHRAIYAPIPQVKDIALINSPLLTGSAMIDSLAPIGKGQNMLVVGQDGVGQRDLAIGMMSAQKEGKVKCIYALTSSDPSEKEAVKAKIRSAGIEDDIVLVTMREIENEIETECPARSAEAISVAATACSIGEAFALAKGEDALVIVDNINEHKIFWDWTTRVLVDVFGVDSVVKDDENGGSSSEMRAFYSNLIQRAGRFKESRGGGSMTLILLSNLEGAFENSDENEDVVFTTDDFSQSSDKIKQRINILVNKDIPLTAKTLRKIEIPVPVASDSEKRRRFALAHADELISMSDGQIWLDEKLYAKGQRPPMDAQRSITRIGVGADTMSRADAPAMRGLAGGLRFDFAQANSLEGAGANSGAGKLILKKKSYLLAMHQEAINGGRNLSENCVALLAASTGSLSSTIESGVEAGTEEGKAVIEGLLKHVWQSAPQTMVDIDTTLDLSDDARSTLERIILDYFSLE